MNLSLMFGSYHVGIELCCKIWRWMLRDEIIIQLCILSHFIDKDIPERWLLTCNILCRCDSAFLSGVTLMLFACVVWLKLVSYAHTNYDMRALTKSVEKVINTLGLNGEKILNFFFLKVNFSLFSLTKQKKIYLYVFFSFI